MIHGYHFVPHDPLLFADVYLHPNDEGFTYFAKNVCAQVAKHL